MRTPLLAALLTALSLAPAASGQDSLDVTFRFIPDLTAPPISPVARAFVPGSFNDWGPNSNGQIATGAPSQMDFYGPLSEYRYTIRLEVGGQGNPSDPAGGYTYKIHYHRNSSGTDFVWLTDPLGSETFGAFDDSVVRVADPMAFQLAREENASGEVTAVSAGLFGSQAFTSVTFTVNDDTYTSGIADTGDGIYRLTLPAPVPPGSFFRVQATDALGRMVDESVGIVPPVVIDAARPEIGGEPVRDGLTVLPSGDVVFSLFAPGKTFVHLIGGFNNWTPEESGLLFRDSAGPDSTWWWRQISGLDLDAPTLYQYLVNGEDRVVDPYARLVLDPGSDPFIPASTFPDLPAYPEGLTSGHVGVLWPGRFDYTWQTTGWTPPEQKDLVIYELLVRDFLAAHDYDTLTDTLDYLAGLGVNAVELMPVSEFGGNLNWGYQPTFHLALDKYYGPPEQFKAFVDAAHARGIAVILDVVYNHADTPSPLVDLYGCTEANLYTNNPPRHEFNVFCDLDHSNPATQYWLDRANAFWIEEYRVDGFRFDLTGGFMQTGQFFPGNSGVNTGRVALLERMVERLWNDHPEAYVILEHLVESQAEYRALAQIGRGDGQAGPMLWNHMNRPYSELVMGYPNDPDAAGLPRTYPPTFFGVSQDESYVSNAVTYMESHDEQWLMRRILAFGNSGGGYDTRDLATALNRIKLGAAFFLTVPGPRMMWQFGELGYGFGQNECLPEDGLTCNVGRTDPKPIRWEYAQNETRRRLYSTYAALNDLRRSYDLFTDPATEVTFVRQGSGWILRLALDGAPAGEPTRAVVAGNFGVAATNLAPSFPAAGEWYDYFFDGSLSVADPGMSLPFLPGEFHIWTDVDIPSPPGGLITVDTEPDGAPPAAFRLEAVAPNPARGPASVAFSLAEAADARLDVFDVLGRRVATLVDGPLAAGSHRARLAADALPSGVYVLRLTAGEQAATQRLTVIR